MFDNLAASLPAVSPSSLPSSYLVAAGAAVLATPLLIRLAAGSKNTNKNKTAMSSSSSTAAAAVPVHTVVILGAGFAGVPMAHHLLKHTPAGVVDVRVVLVAPNDAFYWNAAAPRGVLPADAADPNPKGSPGYGDDKLFRDIAAAFAPYNQADAPARFRQVVGRATRLDPDAQTVDVALVAGGAETVRYDTVLVATGSDVLHDMPFKTLPVGGTPATKAALAALRTRVAAASRIVVAGGGMTGVETAAELGYAYGGGRASASAAAKKEIILVVDGPAPLTVYKGVKDAVHAAAVGQLTKLGVRIITNTRVTATAVDDATHKTTLTLTSAQTPESPETLDADVYIPAFGVSYNVQFLPPQLVGQRPDDPTGQARVLTRRTLQAEGYDNIFVAGDAANLMRPNVKTVEDHLQLLGPQLQTYLAHWAAAAAATAAGQAPPPASPLKEIAVSNGVLMAVSLGPGGGTGQMGAFRFFSFMITLFKARYLGTDKIADYANGKRTFMNTKW